MRIVLQGSHVLVSCVVLTNTQEKLNINPTQTMDNKDRSAYPIPPNRSPDYPEKNGLTKREYIAAMAMQGLLSNPDWMKEHLGVKYLLPTETVSEIALKHADALLTALSEETK